MDPIELFRPNNILLPICVIPGFMLIRGTNMTKQILTRPKQPNQDKNDRIQQTKPNSQNKTKFVQNLSFSIRFQPEYQI